MAISYHKTMDMYTVDTDGICASQTPTGAGSLSINGVEASSDGTWASPDATAHRVGITSVGDDSGRTFTITGTVRGHAVTEAVVGANAGTAESTQYFDYISDTSVDDATADAVTVGVVDEAILVIPVDYTVPNLGITIVVTGTITYSLDHTQTNIHAVDRKTGLITNAYTDWNWINNSDISSATTSAESGYVFPIEAIRIRVESYSTGAELQIDAHQPYPSTVW